MLTHENSPIARALQNALIGPSSLRELQLVGVRLSVDSWQVFAEGVH